MSTLKTELSVKQIQLALRNASFLFNRRSDIIVPNVSWGLLPYEADLLAISKSGLVTEVEIKRSLSDLKADFRKHHLHDHQSVAYFYYCVPEAIEDKAKKAILAFWKTLNEEATEKDCPALLCFSEKGMIKDTKFGTARRARYDKPSLEDVVTVGRLASLRYWNLLEDVVEPEDRGLQKRLRDCQEELRETKRVFATCEEDYNILKRFLRKRYPEAWKEFLDMDDEQINNL